QDGIEQRRRLTIIDHRIERTGERAGVGAVVAPAETGSGSAQRAALHGVVGEQGKLVLRRGRERRGALDRRAALQYPALVVAVRSIERQLIVEASHEFQL